MLALNSEIYLPHLLSSGTNRVHHHTQLSLLKPRCPPHFTKPG